MTIVNIDKAKIAVTLTGCSAHVCKDMPAMVWWTDYKQDKDLSVKAKSNFSL